MQLGMLGKVYQNGEVIVRQGEVGDCMYILLGGRAEVVADGSHGEVVISVLEQGSVFGEMALFTRTRRSATVRAVGEARVLTLKKRDFMSRVHEDPSLAFRILQQMSDRIRTLDSEVTRLKATEGVDGTTSSEVGEHPT